MEVGSVDKDLVIDPIRIGVSGDGNKPHQAKPPGQSATVDPKASGEVVCGFTGQDPVEEDGEMALFLRGGACVDRRGFAGWAYPALGAGCGFPIFYKPVAAQRADRPVLLCHSQGLAPLRRTFTTTLA